MSLRGKYHSKSTLFLKVMMSSFGWGKYLNKYLKFINGGEIWVEGGEVASSTRSCVFAPTLVVAANSWLRQSIRPSENDRTRRELSKDYHMCYVLTLPQEVPFFGLPRVRECPG